MRLDRPAPLPAASFLQLMWLASPALPVGGFSYSEGQESAIENALAESAKSYREKFVGRKMSVLWESTSEMGEWGWQMEGLTENYLRTQAFAPSPRWNELDEVLLQESSGDKLKGVISKMG